MKQELTFIQEAMMKAIKKHNKEREGLEKFNKCIKFERMGRYLHEGYKEYEVTGYKDKSGEYKSYVRYEVECSFKPEKKYDDNIVIFEVYVFSDGAMDVFYDGTKFRIKLNG